MAQYWASRIKAGTGIHVATVSSKASAERALTRPWPLDNSRPKDEPPPLEFRKFVYWPFSVRLRTADLVTNPTKTTIVDWTVTRSIGKSTEYMHASSMTEHIGL